MPTPKITMSHPEAGFAQTTRASFDAIWKAKGWRLANEIDTPVEESPPAKKPRARRPRALPKPEPTAIPKQPEVAELSADIKEES